MSSFIHERHNGVLENIKSGFQPMKWKAPEASERLLGAILRRGRRMPESLKNATLDEVKTFLATK